MPVYGFQLEVEGDAIKSIHGIEHELGNLGVKSKEVHDRMNVDFSKLNEKVKGFGHELKGLALGGLGIGTLFSGVAFAHESMQAFDAFEENVTKLETALTSTGHAAGLTLDDLKDSAKELNNQSLFSKASIMDAQSMLLTFTQIRGTVFNEAIPAIMDFATRYKTDPVEAALQVGKALNDPEKGLHRLTKMGVVFSAQQEKQIKDFMAVNNVAAAQRVMLNELNTEFGGLAKAMTTTDAGKLKMASKSLSEMKITIGEMISKGLMKMSPLVIKIGEGFTEVFGHKKSELMEDERKKLDELVFSLNDVNKTTEERRSILEEIRKISPSIADSIKKEGDQYIINAKALREFNDQMINRIVIQKRQEEIDKNAKKAQGFSENLDKYSSKLREEQVNIIDAIAKKAPGLAQLASKAIAGETFDPKVLKDYYEANKNNKTVQWLKENQLLEGLNLGDQAQNLAQQSELLSKMSKHLGIDPEGIASGMKDYYDILTKVNEAQYNYNNFVNYGNSLTKEKERIAKMLGIGNEKKDWTDKRDGIAQNAFTTSALGGASGGLGEAKIIKIDFHKALMEVNVPGGNGMDIVAKAPMSVEMMLRIINNLSMSQGSTM